MINVEYIENKANIAHIKISGHANYDDYGKDIVCSAVSAISIGALNALRNIENYAITQKEGLIIIESKNESSYEDNIILQTMLIQLKTIEQSYPKFIQIVRLIKRKE